MLRGLTMDLNTDSRPFLKPGRQWNVSEDALIARINTLLAKGTLRRFAAILNHYQLGLKTNCLCAWRAAPRDLSRCGRIMASFPEVSHCLARRPQKHWPYNLYTMVHSRNKVQMQRIIRRISRASGIREYKPLYTLKEFKNQAI